MVIKLGKPKQKEKINIDELLEGVNKGKISELMNPVKPFNRQLHIEILGFKDDKTMKELRIKKDETIKELVVDFNSASREVLKVKSVKGRVKALYEWLRIKDYCRKHEYMNTSINHILNTEFPELKVDGGAIDYVKLHERIFFIEKHSMNKAILGINFKSKIDEETHKITRFAGDITILKILDAKVASDILRLIPQKFKQMPIIRIVTDKGTRRTLPKYEKELFNGKWRYSLTGDIKGYFPQNILRKYNCRTSSEIYVELNDEIRKFYRQPARSRERRIESIFETLGRTRERDREREIRRQVTIDLEDDLHRISESMNEEGYDVSDIDAELVDMVNREVVRRVRLLEESRQREEARRRETGRDDRGREILSVGTRVVIEHGGSFGRRGLNDGRQECVILRYDMDNRYVAEFPDGVRWRINPDEIVEVLGREGDEVERLPIGTEVIIEHGNNWHRINLNDGRQRCRIVRYAGAGQPRFDYEAEFPNGDRWWIKAGEIEKIEEIHNGENEEVEENTRQRYREAVIELQRERASQRRRMARTLRDVAEESPDQTDGNGES